MEILDTEVCQSYGYFCISFLEGIRLTVSIFTAIPLLIPSVFPLIILCIFVTRYFNAASAQFRRIASNSMSIVCSAVQDAYTGVSEIRVYNAVQRFRNHFAKKLDHTVESNAVEIIANCWVQLRMDAFTDITIFCFLLVAIWFSNNGWITLGLLGLIVNSSVSVNHI